MRLARASRATGATNSVDVFLDVFRKVVVDDEFDPVDVQTTRCDVGGEHDGRFPLSEFFQHPIALFLFLGPVKTERGPTLDAKAASQRVDVRLGLDEDEQLTPIHLFLERGHERVVFFVWSHDVDDLFDVLTGEESVARAAHAHLHGVVSHKLSRGFAHLHGPRRGEEERLPVRPGLLHDASNLRFETHV